MISVESIHRAAANLGSYVILGCGFACILVAITGNDAVAHTPVSAYYDDTWNEPDGEIDWRFGAQNAPLANQAWRDRVAETWETWRNVDSADDDGNKIVNDESQGFLGYACGHTEDVWVFSIGIPTADNPAIVNICGEGTILVATIRFDTGIGDWYKGTGSPGASEYDLLSVSTHEIGHVYGFGTPFIEHFSGSTDCPNSAARQTMCQGTVIGKTWKRTLESHDIHTHQAAY